MEQAMPFTAFTQLQAGRVKIHTAFPDFSVSFCQFPRLFCGAM
jgi:hypothetical protein